MGEPDEEVRPRAGSIQRRAGYVEAVRFVPTDDPKLFMAVTPDGERIRIHPGDELTVDVLGPGQSVIFRADCPAHGPGWRGIRNTARARPWWRWWG